LAHFFNLDPDCTEVCTYGEDAAEVDHFLDNAVMCADVVVMDQHLEYATRRFLGTDLAQALLSRGYAGLICIRSANATAADEEAYLASGAHCVVGKEVQPKELLVRLKTEYRRLAITGQRNPKRSAIQRLLSLSKGAEGGHTAGSNGILPGQVE
jgi:DNA-binding response OmpR family regulator